MIVLLYLSFSHFVGFVSHRSSLACVTEMLHTDKSDSKGKGKESDRGQNVIDLMSDHDDLVLDNGGDERKDHKLVKKLLSSMLGSLYFLMQMTWL